MSKRRLAEHRDLLDVVGQVGIVGRVGGEAVGHRRRGAGAERGVGEGVIARGGQALAVEAVGVANRRRRPRHWNGPSLFGREPDLLREASRGRSCRPGSTGSSTAAAGIAEIDRDAAGQRAGVAADEDVAVDVGGDRGQLDARRGRSSTVRSASKVSSAKPSSSSRNCSRSSKVTAGRVVVNGLA